MSDIVGNYKVSIFSVLGKGTFGQVYKGVHKDNEKEEVAVKQIHLSHDDVDAHDSRLHDMAQAEIDALRSLKDHPNIVRLLQCITKGDSVFIVMEYCDLKDVSVYLRRNKGLNLVTKVDLMTQATNAIAFMHGQEKPIIHRDLKLENILLKSENGKAIVKIADFGLAMLCEEAQWGSQSSFVNARFMSSVVGTQYFQAPELVVNEEKGTKYDSSVDVFALGLAFEVIFDYNADYTSICPLSVGAKKSGRAICVGQEMLECRREKKPLPVIEEILPADSAQIKALKQLLLKMTEFKPEDRENISKVNAELKKLLETLKEKEQLQPCAGYATPAGDRAKDDIKDEAVQSLERDVAKASLSDGTKPKSKQRDDQRQENTTGVLHSQLAELREQKETQATNIPDAYDAKAKCKKALAEEQEKHGDDHINVAMVLNLLATVYKSEKKHSEVVKLCNKSIPIMERDLHGPDKMLAAKTLKELADAYRRLEQYAKSESTHERVITIHKQVLGFEHPDVASQLVSLAAVQFPQEKYPQAEKNLKLAVKIYAKTKGRDHPTVAKTKEKLAAAYERQEEFGEAEDLYEGIITDVHNKEGHSGHPIWRDAQTEQTNQAQHMFPQPLPPCTFKYRDPIAKSVLKKLAQLYKLKGWKRAAQMLLQCAH